MSKGWIMSDTLRGAIKKTRGLQSDPSRKGDYLKV